MAQLKQRDMGTSRPEYKVSEEGRDRTFLYRGPSLVTAARIAREAAQSGRLVRLRGPKGFRTRLYKPELASYRKRWWYVVFCPQCGREMFPDSRSNTCRKCWDPRNSEAHMAAVRALNEARAKRS